MKHECHNIYTIIKEVIADKGVCLTKDISRLMYKYGLTTMKYPSSLGFISRKIRQNINFWPDLCISFSSTFSSNNRLEIRQNEIIKSGSKVFIALNPDIILESNHNSSIKKEDFD